MTPQPGGQGPPRGRGGQGGPRRGPPGGGGPRGRHGGGSGGRGGGGGGSGGRHGGAPGGGGGGAPRTGPPKARFDRTDVPRVWRSPYGVLTESGVKGVRVYGEKLFTVGDAELRAWNPRRSKLAALLIAGSKEFNVLGNEEVLYLGAASGTTVSHVADLVPKGRVVAVERSARSFRDLTGVARLRGNVDPLLEDAHATDKLVHVMPGGADIVYQDIAQRDQSAIFEQACLRFLKPGGLGVLMVKARSIDIAREPRVVYDEVATRLQKAGFVVVERRELEPWEKDHAALLVRRKGE